MSRTWCFIIPFSTIPAKSLPALGQKVFTPPWIPSRRSNTHPARTLPAPSRPHSTAAPLSAFPPPGRGHTTPLLGSTDTPSQRHCPPPNGAARVLDPRRSTVLGSCAGGRRQDPCGQSARAIRRWERRRCGLPGRRRRGSRPRCRRQSSGWAGQELDGRWTADGKVGDNVA
jgi:hypothetical protein